MSDRDGVQVWPSPFVRIWIGFVLFGLAYTEARDLVSAWSRLTLTALAALPFLGALRVLREHPHLKRNEPTTAQFPLRADEAVPPQITAWPHPMVRIVAAVAVFCVATMCTTAGDPAGKRIVMTGVAFGSLAYAADMLQRVRRLSRQQLRQ